MSGVAATAESMWLALEDARYRARYLGFAALSAVVLRLFHLAMERKLPHPSAAEFRAIQGRWRALLDEDLRAGRDGHLPAAMVFERPTFNGAAAALLIDAPRIVRRKRLGQARDLPAAIDDDFYPAYYLRNFHWQSDGWLSTRSARLYDPGVQVLFGGTADVMRRTLLPPLLEALGGHSRPRILDVASGTGRLLGMMAHARPDARLTGVDLSRPYVRFAQQALERQGANADVIVENAEALPFKDASFDAVTCAFLFHELPRDARRRVAREAWRVLRPGGRLVVLDSAQLHDGSDIATFLESFPVLYHELYFKSFLLDPIHALLEECGFVIEDERAGFVSTRTVARKEAEGIASHV